MGPECTGSYFFDAILARLENAYYGGASPTKLDRIRKIYRGLVPSRVREKLNRLKTVKTAYEKNQKSIYQHRRFFETIPNHATGGVRINRKGRENFGMVEPGPACDALCERLCRDLREIINLDTGEPVAESVTLTADVYSGPKLEELPDILVEWNKTAQIDRIFSPLFGTMDNTLKSDRSGDHVNKTGFYFASGPGLSPGQNSEPVDVLDFAPTILTMLGVDVRDRHYPGQMIESFIREPIRQYS
jgi:predicted AlkP superfamily phosphohydrolase/phosphomutase